MSGGRLVVLDRTGRDVKRYELAEGFASLGSDPSCDIRVLQRAVRPHHAKVVVHAARTVVRNVGDGATLVNGAAVSVAALRHGDLLTVGDRHLRWEYAGTPPPAPRLPPPPPALPPAPAARPRRLTGGGGEAARDRGVAGVLELRHRASAPARQVAVVLPRSRTTQERSPVPPGESPAEQSAADSTPTQASLWIESRKAAPSAPTAHVARAHSARRRTPLRLTVLRKAQTEKRLRLVKIQAPLEIDRTKRAAIMLMTGHTLQSKQSLANQSNKNSPSYGIKKKSPVRKTPRGKRAQSGRGSGETGSIIDTPSLRAGSRSFNRSLKRNSGNRSATILEITDTTQNTTRGSTISTRAGKSSQRSPPLPSPKKSAMKDHSKKGSRKTESIKFDLSNLETQQDSQVLMDTSDENLTLHYSESSDRSPSPRKSIHSRSGRILEKLGKSLSSSVTSATLTPATLSPQSPRARRSIRSSAMVQKAMEANGSERKLESYSVVDLVSLDSDGSVYDSMRSSDTGEYRTPRDASLRTTRSTIDPVLLGSSTPNIGLHSMKESESVMTPENKQISVKGARVSRRSRSRSRINDSDLLLLDETEVEDASPKTSKRSRATKSSIKNDTTTGNISTISGTSTPENRHGPEEAGTPVLSIQSLLESSRTSTGSRSSRRKSERNATESSSVRRSFSRLSSASRANDVTPTSAVKITPDAVKNKHSTAKRPHSKRSIIDDLDRSDIVKQLFNSPVKRKLSQSMTEFSRKRLLDDDDDEPVRRPKRNTVAVTERIADDSISDNSETFTPDRFVSPIDTPSVSPDSTGAERLLDRNTSNVDVKGVKGSLRTPRTRRSVRNDLTDVGGIKSMFAKSPRNRLSDVRIKKLFAPSPNNGLRRVTGVKTLFQNSPKNDLTDVRGVKKLFKWKSPENDLRNVSGAKRTLRNTPRNDLTDVRGVKRLFIERKERDYDNLSGVEELFDDSIPSAHGSEVPFDEPVGKPPVRSVYSETFTVAKKPKTRKTKSLHSSMDAITNKVEEWLEKELQNRFQKSKNTSKELKKLALEGDDPIRASRTRNSSLRLPIKKRSFESVNNRLPIKKRVVHSTPVKGRLHSTMNASELGRVSPIPAVDVPGPSRPHIKPRSPRKQDTPKKIVSSPPPTEAVKTPPRRFTRNRKKAVVLDNVKKRRSSLVVGRKAPAMAPKRSAEEIPSRVSPENTRARKADKIETPKRTRARRNRAAVVVTEPTPVLKPRARKEKSAKEKSPEVKPRRGRGAEPKVEVPEASPKKTRKTKESKAKVEIEKPTRKRRKLAENESTVQPKRGRKTEAVEPIVPEQTGRKQTRTRGKKTDIEPSDEPAKRTRGAKMQLEEKPNKSGGKKATTDEIKPEERKAKGHGKKLEPQSSVRSEPIVRTRRAKAADLAASLTTGRKRKAATLEEIPQKVTKTEAKKGKKAPTPKIETPQKRKRTAKENVDQNIQVNKSTRTKKTDATKLEKDTKPTRGRKAAAPDDVTVPGAARGGRRKANVEPTSIEEAVQKPATRRAAQVSSPRNTRGRHNARNITTEASTAAGGRSRRR